MKPISGLRPGNTDGQSRQTVPLNRFLTRLIWLCAGPLVLLAIILAGVYVHTIQTEQDREAGDWTRNLAAGLDRDLGGRVAALQTLASSPLIDHPPRMAEFYREAQGFREHFNGHVIMADLATQMLFNTRVPFGEPLPKLPEPKGHAAAPAVLETGKPAVGDMFLGPIAKESLVAVVVESAPVLWTLVCNRVAFLVKEAWRLLVP